MKKILVISIVLVFLISGCTDVRETVRVNRVIDGDTIELITGEKVRLLGINAPEINEPFYFEAKQRLTFLVERREILLESDIEDIDSYGRLLRYVFINGQNVNVLLVSEGLAYTYIFEDLKYKEELFSAENFARQTKRGLWN